MELNKKSLIGNPVSEGIAIAKAYKYYPLNLEVEEAFFQKDKLDERLAGYKKTMEKGKEELQQLVAKFHKEDEDKAKIFLAHQEILEDEDMLEEIEMAITDEYCEPDYAIERVFNFFAEMLKKVDNPLIAGRAADLYDVKNRLIRIYQGKEERKLSDLEEDVIVIAHDLFPSDIANLDREHVKGIVTEIGGDNSHTAILARSYGIPAILGVENAMEMIEQDIMLGMDAIKGNVVLEPGAEERTVLIEKEAAFNDKRKLEALYLEKPGLMKDGAQISIGINVGTPEYDVVKGAYDFIGLFRTEFLYMENTHFPTEEEQYLAYKKILQNAGDKPVTLRTLDIGGDKSLPYMELPTEENPFLGKRALRLCLEDKELFRTQIRAALRASVHGKLQIMFPMVGRMEDIYQAKAFVETVKNELRAEEYSFDENIKLGIMIEIPSIAMIADLAAEAVDFASIGSNDLTQYMCAADRMNPQVTSYYENYSPAMLRILGHIFEAFEKKGKPVSVCGEMAGNPKAAVLLAGLGAKKLSMTAGCIPRVKAALAEVSCEEARQMAEHCKMLATEVEIKDYMKF